MTVTGKYRGHAMTWDEGNEVWRYDSDQTPIHEDKGRPCGECNLPNREDGHDACIGELPGIMNACCGHGIIADAYVQFHPGKQRIAGKEAREYMTARQA